MQHELGDEDRRERAHARRGEVEDVGGWFDRALDLHGKGCSWSRHERNTGALQERYKSVTRALKGRFMGVTRAAPFDLLHRHRALVERERGERRVDLEGGGKGE